MTKYYGPWSRGMYVDSKEFIRPLDWRYSIEKWLYGVSCIIGVFAFGYTLKRLLSPNSKNRVWAARLLSYKISLTVADVIILFFYAPTQFIWISTFWWYAGDFMCKFFKFVSTFGFHLTANMQVLIAFDRLSITSTMTSNRTKYNRQDPYNTRLYLCFAWVLALLCSAPQLMIFGVAQTSDHHDQCISLWLQKRIDHVEQLEYLHQYEIYLDLKNRNSSEVYFENGTLQFIIEKPDFNQNSIQQESENMMLIEQIYNVIHLTTLCAIPYILELLFYTFILYILKGAKYGYFFSITDAVKAKFLCCYDPLPRSTVPRSSSMSGPNTMRGSCRSLDKKLIVQSTPLVRQSSFHKVSVHLQSHRSSETNLVENEMGRDRSASCSNVIDFRNVQAKCFPHEVELISADSVVKAPWLATVAAARHRARMKAFCMLSFNLVLWGPYCVVGIMNAVTVFTEFANFQFVAALVAFNAICNILL